jgi:hypothetical protein
MSSVRTHGCTSTTRRPAGWRSPRKNGTSGCMPAVMKSVDASPAGTIGAAGITAWPRSA